MSQQTKTGLIAVGIVGGVFLLAGLVVVGIVIAKRAPADGGPNISLTGLSEDKQGMKWSVDDLAAYLRKRSLKVEVVYAKSTTGRFSVSETFLKFQGGTPEAELADTKTWDLRGYVEINSWPNSTPANNRDQASRQNSEHPGTAFAWGRFFFRGDPTCISKIRSILE